MLFGATNTWIKAEQGRLSLLGLAQEELGIGNWKLGIVSSPAALNFHSSGNPNVFIFLNWSNLHSFLVLQPGCSCLSCCCGLWGAAWALLGFNQTWPKSLWSPEFLAQEWKSEFLEETAEDPVCHSHPSTLCCFHPPPPHCLPKENDSFLKNSLLIEECCVL